MAVFHQYMFDCWADTVVHLLLFKRSMVKVINLFRNVGYSSISANAHKGPIYWGWEGGLLNLIFTNCLFLT